jgi:carbon monoxide dehydrogenase subunit G
VNFEFKALLAAPIDRVWDLMLDPNVMAGCMPGTESVEVVSEVEYVAVLKVKISCLSARFKLKTTIVEKKPPTYLRFEGTGEDKSVGSALKQTTEVFLAGEGSATSILVQTRADVLGRLGSFGLSIMKTKAERMWDEFVDNLRAIAEKGGEGDAVCERPQISHSASEPDSGLAIESAQRRPSSEPRVIEVKPPPDFRRRRWWRLFGRRSIGSAQVGVPLGDQRQPGDIYIEVRRRDTVVRVLWPESASGDAAAWLKDFL